MEDEEKEVVIQPLASYPRSQPQFEPALSKQGGRLTWARFKHDIRGKVQLLTSTRRSPPGAIWIFPVIAPMCVQRSHWAFSRQRKERLQRPVELAEIQDRLF